MRSYSYHSRDLRSGPTAPYAIYDEMQLPSRDDVDWRTLLPPHGTTVIISVVPDRRCMPMAVHQRHYMLNGHMGPKALETSPK